MDTGLDLTIWSGISIAVEIPFTNLKKEIIFTSLVRENGMDLARVEKFTSFRSSQL